MFAATGNRQILLSVLFAFLALAGGAGSAFESMHHGGDRCPACENAMRPAGDASSIRSCAESKKICFVKAFTRKSPSNAFAFCPNSCLNNPQNTCFRVLLI